MQRFSISAGFSLIELMIVVSLISILTIIAIPSYQGYTQRARFAEVISTAQLFKTAVTIALQQGVPLVELAAGKQGIPNEPKSTKNLASIKIENGVITSTGSEKVNGATYVLTPDVEGSTWTISGSCLKTGLCNA